MKRSILRVFGGLVLLGVSVGANAAFISGSATIIGYTTVDTTANTIDFDKVLSAFGTPVLDGLSPSTVTLYDLAYSDTPGATNSPVWSFTSGGETFSFTLESVSKVEETSVAGYQSVHLVGTGTLAGTSYDPTHATFDLLAGGAPGFETHLTMTAASPVPIPAAGWLFGSALMGITAVARRKAATSKKFAA